MRNESCRPRRAVCRLPPASCLLPPASCLLPPASCLLPPAVPPNVAYWSVSLRSPCHVALSRQAVKLTYMPFLIKALSLALHDYPEINATFSSDQGHVIQRAVRRCVTGGCDSVSI